jgi:hypothetical protein
LRPRPKLKLRLKRRKRKKRRLRQKEERRRKKLLIKNIRPQSRNSLKFVRRICLVQNMISFTLRNL